MAQHAAVFQVWEQVKISISDQIEEQIKFPILTQIRDQVREQTKCRISEQLRSPVINAVCPVWDDIFISSKRDIDESKRA
jgi:hypothetical protein